MVPGGAADGRDVVSEAEFEDDESAEDEGDADAYVREHGDSRKDEPEALTDRVAALSMMISV